MGASALTRKYKVMDKGSLKLLIENDRENDISEDGEIYSGSWGSKCGRVIFLNEVLKSYDLAYEMILDKSDKWEPLIAIRVKELEDDGIKEFFLVGGWCPS